MFVILTRDCREKQKENFVNKRKPRCSIESLLWRMKAKSTYIYRVQSSVCRLPNYWPPTPSIPSECVLPSHQRLGYTVHTRRAVRGWGSIFRKMPDIGLASNSIIPLRMGGCGLPHVSSSFTHLKDYRAAAGLIDIDGTERYTIR